MQICLAGKNSISLKAAEFIRRKHGSHALCVLPNTNDVGLDTWQPSLKRWAILNQVPVVLLEELYLCDDLLFISLEFDRLISPANFRSDRLFNLHFSLLPEYKGAYTSIWPILDGKDYSGVTLHRIDRGIDTGDIIAQDRIPITLADTSRILYDKYLSAGYDLFQKWFPRLLNGGYIALPQTIENSSFRSRSSIVFEDLTIDLKQTAFAIHNQIRGFTFREYQLPYVRGFPISRSEITHDRSKAKPGSILEDTEEFMRLSTIDYDTVLYKDSLELLLSTCRHGTGSEIRRLALRLEDINLRNCKGWSALMVSAYHSNLEALKVLMELGADVKQTNYNGTTVAMYARSGATKSRDLSCLSFVLGRGAELHVRDVRGKNILNYAVDDNFPELIELLRTRGAEE